jgi:hypothetical protein
VQRSGIADSMEKLAITRVSISRRKNDTLQLIVRIYEFEVAKSKNYTRSVTALACK